MVLIPQVAVVVMTGVAGRTDATRGMVGNREPIVHTDTEVEVTTAGDKRFYTADVDGGNGIRSVRNRRCLDKN